VLAVRGKWKEPSLKKFSASPDRSWDFYFWSLFDLKGMQYKLSKKAILI